MTKKYKLLKDLPWAKAGDEYYLNRHGCYVDHNDNPVQLYPYILENKEWFSEITTPETKQETERVVVKEIGIDRFTYLGVDTCSYHFSTSKSVSEDKFPLIKQAIESCLNEPKPEPTPQQSTKEVLFVTEDGVKICLFDKYWFVNVGSGFPNQIYWSAMSRCADITHPEGTMVKTFSTEEKAKEYILLNKPCLSVADIIQMDMNLNQRQRLDIWKDKVLEVAKSKTNTP